MSNEKRKRLAIFTARVMRLIIATLIATTLATFASAANPSALKAIRTVTISHDSLNVSAGETVSIALACSLEGRVSIVIVDRDGYPTRVLAKNQIVRRSFSVDWDGRDDAGRFVPDEAYSLKVDWRGVGGAETYFPADVPQIMESISPRSYSRRTATLTYSLSRPSRVHVQAGTAAMDAKTKKPAGAVMKTVVNREPRTSGTIAEHWNGFDESGAIFVPDLPDFVVAIAASPLPENSIITFGNRERRFVDTLTARRGSSFLSRWEHGNHHTGLPTRDDVSPELTIEPVNAVWSAAQHAWILNRNKPLRMRLSVQGPTAARFRTHPATIEVFLDGRRIGEPAPKHADTVEVPLDPGAGVRRVCVNWNSEWGPVAANTVQVLVREAPASAGVTR